MKFSTLLLLVAALAMPSMTQAQFNYTTSGSSATITGYYGTGGTVAIPATIDGYTVTGIGTEAFDDWTTITNVTVPNSVASIGDWAFLDCSNMTNVVIGPGVTSIGEYAFSHCNKLTAAYFEGNAPYAGTPTFYNTQFYDCPVTVYYMPGTTNWGATFGGATTELWNPEATALTTAGGQFGFNITGPNRATIVVEACTNLTNPTWLPVSTNTLSSGGASSFLDLQSTNYPNRYYRFTAP